MRGKHKSSICLHGTPCVALNYGIAVSGLQADSHVGAMQHGLVQGPVTHEDEA